MKIRIVQLQRCSVILPTFQYMKQELMQTYNSCSAPEIYRFRIISQAKFIDVFFSVIVFKILPLAVN